MNKISTLCLLTLYSVLIDCTEYYKILDISRLEKEQKWKITPSKQAGKESISSITLIENFRI